MPTPRSSLAPAMSVQEWPWEKTCLYFAKNFKLDTRKGTTEHVSCEGPNGSGKSLLMLGLLQEVGQRRMRDGRPLRITILGTKNRDRTLSDLGWPRITKLDEWPPGYGEEHVLAWPTYGNASTASEAHAKFFRPILDEIRRAGNQIVYIDEAAYFADKAPDGLGLGGLLTQYWIGARSDVASLWAATQRPVRVPVAMWSESSWLFLFRTPNIEDLKTIGDRGGERETILSVLPELDDHQFLMLRRRGGGLAERVAVVSQVEL